jgi:hypothetical protein
MSTPRLTIAQLIERLRITEKPYTAEELEFRTHRIPPDKIGDIEEFRRHPCANLPDPRAEALESFVHDPGFNEFGKWCLLQSDFKREASALVGEDLVETLAIRFGQSCEVIGGLLPEEAIALFEGRLPPEGVDAFIKQKQDDKASPPNGEGLANATQANALESSVVESGSGHADVEKITPKSIASEAIGLAYEMVVAKKGINVAAIARKLKVERTSLYDYPGFRALLDEDRASRKPNKNRWHSGSKDRQTRSVEALDRDD